MSETQVMIDAGEAAMRVQRKADAEIAAAKETQRARQSYIGFLRHCFLWGKGLPTHGSAYVYMSKGLLPISRSKVKTIPDLNFPKLALKKTLGVQA